MRSSKTTVKQPTVEDIAPLVNYEANINRLDQTTPFGSVKYDKPEVLGYDDWLAQNPHLQTQKQQIGAPAGLNYRNWRNWMDSQGLSYGSSSSNRDGTSEAQQNYQKYRSDQQNAPNVDLAGEYAKYKSGIEAMPATGVGIEFSPELQDMFDTRFSSGADYGTGGASSLEAFFGGTPTPNAAMQQPANLTVPSMFSGSPGAVSSGAYSSYLGPLGPIREPGAIPNPDAMQRTGLPGALQRTVGPAGMRATAAPGGLRQTAGPSGMSATAAPGGLQRVAGPAGMQSTSMPGGLQRVQGPQTNEGAPVDFDQYRDPYDLGQPDRFDPFFDPGSMTNMLPRKWTAIVNWLIRIARRKQTVFNSRCLIAGFPKIRRSLAITGDRLATSVRGLI